MDHNDVDESDTRKTLSTILAILSKNNDTTKSCSTTQKNARHGTRQGLKSSSLYVYFADRVSNHFFKNRFSYLIAVGGTVHGLLPTNLPIVLYPGDLHVRTCG